MPDLISIATLPTKAFTPAATPTTIPTTIATIAASVSAATATVTTIIKDNTDDSTTTASILSALFNDIILPTIFKRDYSTRDHKANQLGQFTDHQARVQRIVAISSSCGSIAAALIAMYFLFAIDPKRIVFRHQLIFFLLFFDLLKACILLLYPTRILTHSSAYYNHNFCQVVGFFTATAIEGADIAIFAFAFHTYLLIFKPSFNTKVKNSNRVEGGLYKFRYYVYSLSFFVPLIVASLAFIHSDGYDSLVCWCYLPMRPVWLRLVLSWVPRYCIVVGIFVIYGLIYIRVISEFKTLGGVFKNAAGNGGAGNLHLASSSNPTFFSSLKYFFVSMKDQWFPNMSDDTIAPITLRHSHSHNASGTIASPHRNAIGEIDNDDGDDDSEELAEALEDESVDYQDIELNKQSSRNLYRHHNSDIQQANLENFRRRQRIIQKQMKSIFIYPFAYCLVWLFPFILQATQFNYEEDHHAVYWLNVLGALSQPLNGFVDALVFFYRERPWRNTAMKNFEKENRQRVDNIIVNNLEQRKYSEGAESAQTVATASKRIAKNSLSASSGLVNINAYKPWRQFMNKYRFPFYQLPTDKNIAKFQDRYIKRKLRDSRKLDKLVQEVTRDRQDLTFPTNIAEKYGDGSGNGSGSGSGSGGHHGGSTISNTNDSSPMSMGAGINWTEPTNAHDFSNILNTGGNSNVSSWSTKDVPGFKPNFGKFTFGNRSSNLSSRKSSTVIGLHGTGRNVRQPSNDSFNDPVRSLGGRRNSSLVIGNNTTLNKPYEIVSSPTSSTFTPIDRVKSNEDIDELHTVDNNTDKADDNDDGELDLMEFLKKGPPM